MTQTEKQHQTQQQFNNELLTILLTFAHSGELPTIKKIRDLQQYNDILLDLDLLNRNDWSTNIDSLDTLEKFTRYYNRKENRNTDDF